MNKMNKKGFTLIEMLVVIAIIAVLVSIIVPVVGNSTTKAKAATDAANLRSIAASIAIDYMDNNYIDDTFTLPTSESGDGQCTVRMVGNEIKAYFGAKGVEYYAAKAGGETPTEPAENATAPGTEMYGASGATTNFKKPAATPAT